MIDNRSLAARLADYADLLEQQGDDVFRVRAYREAAATVTAEPRPLAEVFAEDGRGGLEALPHIGPAIARALAEMIDTGRWLQLERLRGELRPEQLFRTLPGIGPKLAARMAGEAHLETLEELETALAQDARDLRFLGPRRRGALRAVLAERLARQRRGRLSDTGAGHPPVDMLLKADEIYRARAARGDLPTIAPRRFNPEGRAWLPILHARHDDWHLTLLFSNTELAHRLGRTKDWVVVYAQKADGPEERCSIVTETRGELTGRRVVRGREAECLSHYQRPTAAAGPQIVSRQ